MTILINVLIGVSLAATCGFRVFVPFFVMGIAGMGGYLDLGSGFQWIASYPALIVFGVATLAEILAYFFPYVDNLLTTASVPISTIAGILVTAAVMTDINPILQWALAIIAGGGAATATSIISAGVHHGSTALTGGAANPVLSGLESAAAAIISVIAVVAPFLAIICILLILSVLYKIFGKLRRKPA